jgi:hypothetical protein
MEQAVGAQHLSTLSAFCGMNRGDDIDPNSHISDSAQF